VVAITDKVRLPEPAHGGGVVGCAKVAVASCWIVLLDEEHNPDHAGQKLEEVDRLAPSEMQRDLPAPSPTRFERVAAETVLTSVSPKNVVRLSSCQKVQVDAGVGVNKEVLPEYQVHCLLGGKTGALELVGANYCASKTAKEMVSLDHNIGDVLESANHCLQGP